MAPPPATTAPVEEPTAQTTIPTQDPRPTGGCLQPFWRAWSRLSTQAGEWVKNGVRLPWRCIPKACKRKQRHLEPIERQFLRDEITRMLKEGAITPTSRQDLVLNSIYTVPKKNGKRRAVVNLRWVNSHLHRNHFKMTTMRDVKAAMTQNCWMSSIDLKDCFWALPVAESDQRVLAFEFEGKKYLFTVLPFGLGPSPLFITKLYRQVVEHLQARGHRVIMYIDDMLLLGATKQECARTHKAAMDLFAELGAVVNCEKSNGEPTQQAEYLGFTLDSVEMALTAPPKKMASMMKALKKCARMLTMTARDVASLLGKLTSMADAMLPVRVHT
jgi:hypothetical protein